MTATGIIDPAKPGGLNRRVAAKYVGFVDRQHRPASTPWARNRSHLDALQPKGLLLFRHRESERGT